MKTYTERGNCIRAARSALKNKEAKPGVDFDIHEHKDGETGKKTFSFSIKQAEKPAKAEKAPRVKPTKPQKRLCDQPQMRKTLKLMTRVAGVTVKGGAEEIGCNVDTFRGMVSRLTKEVKAIQKLRDARTVTYHLPKEALEALDSAE